MDKSEECWCIAVYKESLLIDKFLPEKSLSWFAENFQTVSEVNTLDKHGKCLKEAKRIVASIKCVTNTERHQLPEGLSKKELIEFAGMGEK